MAVFYSALFSAAAKMQISQFWDKKSVTLFYHILVAVMLSR